MNSEWVDIESITPWERNPRMNEHAVQQVAVSIQQFGFLNPIIVQKSTKKIVAGHTRHKAAKSLGLAQVPVIFADLDNSKAQAYAIADNKLGELASWDDSLLAELLGELKEEEFDLSSLGFDEIELADLFNDENIRELNDEGFDEDEIDYDGKVKISVECMEMDRDEIENAIREALKGFADVKLS